MERILSVPSAQKALELMKAMLAANMLDNELEVDDPNSENPEYYIKFGKFSVTLKAKIWSVVLVLYAISREWDRSVIFTVSYTLRPSVLKIRCLQGCTSLKMNRILIL